MKLAPLSRQAVRQVDQVAIEQYGIPGVVLMENAGRGAAEAIQQLAPQGRIVILAGNGNNAGDGYVIARHLELCDRNVRIVSLSEPRSLHGDALVNANIAIAAELELVTIGDLSGDTDRLAESIAQADVVVDCLLGTGARGTPREPFATAVRLANQTSAMRIAIDLPTGMDCDTGELHDPTFCADHTLTFVAPKIGFARAASHVGRVQVISIGVPRKLLWECQQDGVAPKELS